MRRKSIKLLQKELESLFRAKEKSIESHIKGDIDTKLHKTHLKNLEPQIKELSYDINILEKHHNDIHNLQQEEGV
jgi:hypothetical protein